MLADSAVQNFRASLRGQTLCPHEQGYDAARTVPNAMIDRRPAIIARCAGAADVIACVRFAREHDVLVSVRGGGHSVAGKAVCDDGLMIDLSAMKGIRVDPATRTVRAETGLTLGEFDRETQAFGLATTQGSGRRVVWQLRKRRGGSGRTDSLWVQLRPPGRPEGQVRPDQLFPHEPQHQAEPGGASHDGRVGAEGVN